MQASKSVSKFKKENALKISDDDRNHEKHHHKV